MNVLKIIRTNCVFVNKTKLCYFHSSQTKKKFSTKNNNDDDRITNSQFDINFNNILSNSDSYESSIDYDKIIKTFGCSKINNALISKFKDVLTNSSDISTSTNSSQFHLLNKGIYFCHRDFDKIIDIYNHNNNNISNHNKVKTISTKKEHNKQIYLYTGRGPSNKSLHLGHTIPFLFNKYLQDVFDCPLVIQITDDEKFLSNKDLNLDETIKMGYENIKDIIAFGFNRDKTFIFSDIDYIKQLYKLNLKIQKLVNLNTIKSLFGFNHQDNIGKISFPSLQCTPCFYECFPEVLNQNTDWNCLIPCAVDQDPYFRLTRDIAYKLKLNKPACIYSKFLPSLEGTNKKMSSSGKEVKILLTDTLKTIKTKVNKYAYSGGQETAEKQRELGANLDIDISYIYLKYFLDDDMKLSEIENNYSKGIMLSGEVKKLLIETLDKFITLYQEKRNKITDDEVRYFLQIRKIG